MKPFNITWTEKHVMEVEAESIEEARQLWDNGELDTSESECIESELEDVSE